LSGKTCRTELDFIHLEMTIAISNLLKTKPESHFPKASMA